MQSIAVSIATVVVLAMVAVSEEAATSPPEVECPILFNKTADGTCVASTVLKQKYEESFVEGRDFGIPNDCPRCYPKIFDAYPVWDNCTVFIYCLNGHNILITCAECGGRFFNPVTKKCDTTYMPNNNCLFPDYNFMEDNN